MKIETKDGGSIRLLNTDPNQVLVDPDQLTLHPKNPRMGDVGALCMIIKSNGFAGSVLARESDGVILAGNHTVKAARALGMTLVPVTYVETDDLEHEIRLMIGHNQASDLAHNDDELLVELLQQLGTDEEALMGTGFDGSDLDELMRTLESGFGAEVPPAAKIDRGAELAAKWGTAPGQLWVIPSRDGRRQHRLFCGDCQNVDHVERLLDGEAPSLMVTDPPYGVNYDPTWRDGVETGLLQNVPVVMRGDVSGDDEADWSLAWDLSPAEVAYVWHAGSYASTVQRSLEDNNYLIRAQIIWVKDQLVLSRGAYHWKHEPCWYAVKKGKKANWRGGRKQTTVWEITGMNPVGKKAEDPKTYHGTQKPLECMLRPIENHEGDVYDPFVGSGTTIVAAEQQLRSSFCMDISPNYIGIILERLADWGLVPELQPDV